MLNIRYTKSKGIKTKKNHIILFANVEGKAESHLIEKAIKKAAREIRKTTGSGASFEIYINSRNSSIQMTHFYRLGRRAL